MAETILVKVSMNPAEALPSSAATVCGRPLKHSAHICAFFDSREQEYDCLVPYFAEGLARGEQVVTIRDSCRCGDHVDALRSAGAFAVDDSIASNRLRVVASEETYLQEGTFEAERMFTMLEKMLDEAPAEGFTRVRTCGEMSWALRGMPGTDELMRYESEVNRLLARHDCTLMCVYEVKEFSGRAVMDVLATHPMVLMGSLIYENPYYVPPEEFLSSVMRRGAVPLAREPETI